MSIALIVEDGTIVANANSYVTVGEVRNYNIMRGVTLPTSDDDVAVLAIKAMDCLEGYESQLAGKRTMGSQQPLSWPRAGIVIMGENIYSAYVPAAIKAIQCYLAGVATTIDLVGNQDSRAVTLEKIGPLQTNYSETQGAAGPPLLPQLTKMLAPFLRSGVGLLVARRV